MVKNCVVKTLVANLYAKPTFKSELVTQALFNERLEILNIQNNWLKVKQWDDYISWIHKFYISTEADDLSSSWYHINKEIKNVNDLITYANSFVGTPYLWGGRSPFGIDCSGFVQMVYKLNGYKLDRDSHQQSNLGSALSFIEESEPGDLAFFDNDEGKIIHVGIIMENNKIIHASGKVRIDGIDQSGIYNKETKSHTHKLRVIKKII